MSATASFVPTRSSGQAWADESLRSPVSGAVLRRCGHALVAPGERWPVVAEIPYLRVGRAALVTEVLAALDAGAHAHALALLLADQDDWSPTPPPSPADALHVAAGGCGLREALGRLSFGPVAEYFALRPGDPTFLAGLALVRAGWDAPRSAFELACGIGHHLRVLHGAGVPAAGGDVVFAKLWLARRHLVPAARLVCFDAASPWPVEGQGYDLVTCHDAFYFLPEKEAVAARLQALAGLHGTVVVSHAHNVLVDPHGGPLQVGAYARLFGVEELFDDAELQAALLADRAPVAAPPSALVGSEAVGVLAQSRGAAELPVQGPDLALPRAGTPLRAHPLLAPPATEPAWPSAGYAREYGARSAHLHLDAPLSADVLARAAAGAVGSDCEVDELARRRVLLDLPPSW